MQARKGEVVTANSPSGVEFLFKKNKVSLASKGTGEIHRARSEIDVARQRHTGYLRQAYRHRHGQRQPCAC